MNKINKFIDKFITKYNVINSPKENIIGYRTVIALNDSINSADLIVKLSYWRFIFPLLRYRLYLRKGSTKKSKFFSTWKSAQITLTNMSIAYNNFSLEPIIKNHYAAIRDWTDDNAGIVGLILVVIIILIIGLVFFLIR